MERKGALCARTGKRRYQETDWCVYLEAIEDRERRTDKAYDRGVSGQDRGPQRSDGSKVDCACSKRDRSEERRVGKECPV